MMVDEEKQQARVKQLRDFLDGGLRDEHADWITAYGAIAAKVLEQRGVNADTIQGLRTHPVLANDLLTDADKATADGMVGEVFDAIAAAEQHGEEYLVHEVPAAMIAALAHLYPAAQQRQHTL